MPRRENYINKDNATLLLDMPLTQGDLTDHISGGYVVQNGRVSWNSSKNAYYFTQSGNGDNGVARATNLYLPCFTVGTTAKIMREMDIFVESTGDDSLIILSHDIKNQYAYWPSFRMGAQLTNNTPTGREIKRNVWTYYCQYKDFGSNTGWTISDDRLVQSVDWADASRTNAASTSEMQITAGFYGSHSSIKMYIKNLKYWVFN